MGEFFNLSLFDLLINPVTKGLWDAAHLAASASASAQIKERIRQITTSELDAIVAAADSGDADAQCLLALCYADFDEHDAASYWFRKSAENGNERALQIQDMMQRG